jgi:uncharacterized protein YndB with AHSA1/START domain
MIRAFCREATVASKKKPVAKKTAARKAAPKKPKKPKKRAPAGKPKKAARKAAAAPKKTKLGPKAKKAGPKKAAAKKPAPPIRTPKPTALESLSMQTTLLASPERVYAAWIDGGEHSEFTGGEAIIDARVGGKHSAWSGYIEGAFLGLDPGKQLVMTWRTTEFDEADPDSHLVVRFVPDGGGTRVEIEHTGLPPGGAQKYTTGWREFYFIPMAKYFG